MTGAASGDTPKIGTQGFCHDCPYWVAHDHHEARGTCRRYPPVAAVGAPKLLATTSRLDWCGEHPARAPKPHMLSAEDAAWIRGLDIKASMRPGATLATRKRKAA